MRTRATGMEPDRGTPLGAAIRCHMPPHFLGGALSSPSFLQFGTGEPINMG